MAQEEAPQPFLLPWRWKRSEESDAISIQVPKIASKEDVWMHGTRWNKELWNLHDDGITPADFGGAVRLGEAVFELVERMEQHNGDCVV